MKFRRKISLFLASIILILQFSDWVPILQVHADDNDSWINLFGSNKLELGDAVSPDSAFKAGDGLISGPVSRPDEIEEFEYNVDDDSFFVRDSAGTADYRLSDTIKEEEGFNDKVNNLDGLEASSSEEEVINKIAALLITSGTTVSNEFCSFDSNTDTGKKDHGTSIIRDLVKMRMKAKADITLATDMDGDNVKDEDGDLGKLINESTVDSINYKDSNTYIIIQAFDRLYRNTTNKTAIFTWQFYDFTELYYYAYILHINTDNASDDCFYIAQLKSKEPMILTSDSTYNFTRDDTSEIMSSVVSQVARSFETSIYNGTSLVTKEVDRFNDFLCNTFKFYVSGGMQKTSSGDTVKVATEIIPVLISKRIYVNTTFKNEQTYALAAGSKVGGEENVAGSTNVTIDMTPQFADNPNGNISSDLSPNYKASATGINAVINTMNVIITSVAAKHAQVGVTTSPSMSDLDFLSTKKITALNGVQYSSPLYVYYCCYMTCLKERLEQCRDALASLNKAQLISSVGNDGVIPGTDSIQKLVSFYVGGYISQLVKGFGINTNKDYDEIARIPYVLTECKDPKSTGKKIALSIGSFKVLNDKSTALANEHSDYTLYSFVDAYNALDSDFQRVLVDTAVRVELTRMNFRTTEQDGVLMNRDIIFLADPYWTQSPADDSVIKLKDDRFSTGTTQGYISGSQMADFIKEKIDKVDDDVATAVNTPLGWIQYCYEFGLYTFYQGIYGQQDYKSPDKVTSSLYVYSRGLEAYKNLSWKEGIDKVSYFEWGFLPKKMEALKGNDVHKYFFGSSSDTGWYNFVYALHYIALGFDVANQIGSDNYVMSAMSSNYKNATAVEIGYSAEKIREILTSSECSSDYESETFEGIADSEANVTIGMIKAIIGLHDLMDSLGIGKNDWTEAIAEYYDLYELCKRYLNNPLITGGLKAEMSVLEPLGMFFSCSQSEMTDYWNEGVALSTQYVPFQTNLYDSNSITFIDDSEWVSDFYYKYGFYRKALFINTDGDALVNEMTAGTKSGTRVATLKDLVQFQGDVVLYVDDNFYNAAKLQSLLNNIDYTTVRGGASGSTTDANGNTVETTVTDVLGKGVGQLLDIDAETLLKTGSAKYYNDRVAQNCAKLDSDAEGSLSTFIYDAYLLSKDDILGTEEIQSALEYSEYDIKQPFAVVSSVYKNVNLFNTTLKSLVSDNAIFKASKSACGVTSMNTDYYRYFYNYLLLEGLEGAMKNTTDGQLDLTSPIFCDIFGNIITETGYVVIPAAANATLMGDNWSPVSLAFGHLVGDQQIDLSAATEDFKEWFSGVVWITESNGKLDPNGVEVYNTFTRPSSKYAEHAEASGYFCEGANGYMLNNMTVSAGQEICAINWQAMPVNSKQFKRLAYSKCLDDITKTSLFSSTTVNMVMETLRGAPIEFIDYKVEGLEDTRAISGMGVYVAYKLEGFLELIQKASSWFSMLGYPDLMFMEGIEVAVLYIYKIMFAIGVLWLAIQVYLDAISHRISWSSALKLIVTIVCVLSAILFIPKIVSWTYYGANKTLLSEEMGYLQILNYAKDFDGSEIGITELKDPETETNLLVKVGDVHVSWLDMVVDVIGGNETVTMTDIYEEKASLSTMANQPNVQLKGDILYYPVKQLLNDCQVHYSSTGDRLEIRKYSTDGDVISFVMPYYVILEKLVNNVNHYNQEHNIQSVSIGISGGENAGHILTYDVISSYLLSDEFLAEGYDLFEMHRILSTESGEVTYGRQLFDVDDVNKMKTALWYPSDYSADTMRQKIIDLELFARNWVADNKDLLGKVPDEVLLKCFALQLAIEYNHSFGIAYGSSLELIEVDSRDIIRLMLSNKETCYKYFSHNLARFTYEIGGAFSCILLGFYAFIAAILSAAKVVIMVALIALLVVNVLLRGVIFPHEENKAIEGYIVTAALIALSNYLYAFSIKILMSLGNLDAGVVLIIILALIVQLAYIGAMYGIVSFVIKDWKNIGLEGYGNAMVGISQMAHSLRDLTRNSFIGNRNSNYVQPLVNPNPSYNRQGVSVEDMHQRDMLRASKGREPDSPDRSVDTYQGRPNRQNYRK